MYEPKLHFSADFGELSAVLSSGRDCGGRSGYRRVVVRLLALRHDAEPMDLVT